MNTSSILILAGDLLLFIGLLFALMFSYYFLLKRIASTFPRYYEQLGSPFLPTASRSITKTINRDNFNYSLLGKLLKGTPEGFPNDTHLSRLATYVRFEMFAIIAIVGFGIGFALNLYA